MEAFVTCGSGLEPFAMQELTTKFKGQVSVSDDKQPGKLFFALTSDNPLALIEKLINDLKVVERLFGIVHHVQDVSEVKSGHALLGYLFEVMSRSKVIDTLEEWSARLDEISNKSRATLIGKKSKRDIGFRVNVKLSGNFRRMIRDPRQISKCVGSALVKNGNQSQAWHLELRRPEVELSVYVTDAGILLALPLTSKPLSERTYLRHIPLRSTIAAAMGHLLLRHLDLTSSDAATVVDPMCGTATILVELSRNHTFPFLSLFGLDSDSEQLSRAAENVSAGGQIAAARIGLTLGDARQRYPWRGELDAVICDMPFGLQHGESEVKVKESLPAILGQMDSALRSSGIVVLLFSAALSSRLEECAAAIAWNRLERFPVKLGELQAKIFAFQKK